LFELQQEVFSTIQEFCKTPPIKQQEGNGPQVMANDFCYVQFRFSGNPFV
jgi:hypothetical protein